MDPSVEQPPRCAYFYYATASLQADRHEHLDVAAYLMQEAQIGASDKIEDLIPVWAQQAKARQMTPVGWALGDLRWRRRSYLVVVLDAAGVTFDSADDLVITDGDHTFKDKTLIDFTTANGSAMQAIYCRNHIRKRDGTAWKHNESESFSPLRLELARRDGSSQPIVTHDDVGTNTGPPKT